MALPRLHATAADCAHELINGETGKILQNNKRGVLKNGMISGESRLFETREWELNFLNLFIFSLDNFIE